MRLGTSELFIILLVVLILFGPKQIPKLMRLCKKSIRKMKDALDSDEDEDSDSDEDSDE